MEDPFAYRDVWETPAGRLEVAPIAEGDECDLLRFFREGLSDQSNLFLSLHRWHSDEVALAAMRQRIAAHGRREAVVYVTRHEGAIVAYFFLQRLSSPDGPPSLGIGVADALQGCGIGARCMDLLIEAGRSLGCPAIVLTHHPANERAARLYHRKGFRYTGEEVSWQTPEGPRTEPRMILRL